MQLDGCIGDAVASVDDEDRDGSEFAHACRAVQILATATLMYRSGDASAMRCLRRITAALLPQSTGDAAAEKAAAAAAAAGAVGGGVNENGGDDVMGNADVEGMGVEVETGGDSDSELAEAAGSDSGSDPEEDEQAAGEVEGVDCEQLAEQEGGESDGEDEEQEAGEHGSDDSDSEDAEDTSHGAAEGSQLSEKDSDSELDPDSSSIQIQNYVIHNPEAASSAWVMLQLVISSPAFLDVFSPPAVGSGSGSMAAAAAGVAPLPAVARALPLPLGSLLDLIQSGGGGGGGGMVLRRMQAVDAVLAGDVRVVQGAVAGKAGSLLLRRELADLVDTLLLMGR